MDFGYLLRILLRRKWLIAGVALGAALATYVFIGRKPEKYRASVIISTGIVNYKGINSDNSDAFVQQYQVENAFSNLIEFAQSRSCIKLLTIQMLRHDLGGKEGPAFRQSNRTLSGYSDDEAAQLLGDISRLDLDSISDPAFSQQFDYLLDKIARAYGYDHDAIRRALSVKRKGGTDYLTIDMVTENPQLSQFMTNAYVSRLLMYYQNLSVREKKKNVEFYTQLAAEKKAVMDTIKERKYAYLAARGLPALGKQSEELVNKIKQLELERQSAMSSRDAASASVQQIDRYLNNRQSLHADETRSRVLDKYSAADQSEKVRQLREQSIKTGGKDPEIEAQLAEAQEDLEQTIRRSAGNIGKPKQDESRRTKEDLYKEKVQADVERIEAEKAVERTSSELARARAELSVKVGEDEVSSSLDADQLRAEEEFKKVNENLIAAKLALANTENPLHIIENAQLPEWPEPNRQVLISLFAGVVAGTMTIIGLFLLAYFDHSLQSPELFRRYVEGVSLLGAVNQAPLRGLNLQTVFQTGSNVPQHVVFRESLRKIRTLLLKSGSKVILFVSTKPREGKTFIMNALAHSLAANGKRVALVDTNFKSPRLSEFAGAPSPLAGAINKALASSGLTDVFRKKNAAETSEAAGVDVIGNTDLHQSPSELLPPEAFQQFLTALGKQFDYIFLEAAALNDFSDAHELAPFADRVIAVFNAGAVIGTADKDSIEYLKSLGEQLAGAILTGVDARNAG
ncbi:MAG TPA: Wzz/FepE/Etk N-terminal domain-containing protein [Saprospiraceae bacterium]|nr:Wzz/FepE/Etk N-terminal domain-containing protein [Saprospiraceae bacterium]